MYTDKSKHNEASREAMKRYREKRKGITPSVIPDKLYPGKVIPVIPKSSFDEVQECHDVMLAMVRTFIPDLPVVIRTDREVKGVVTSFRVDHHPTCRCYRCKPPKGN